MLLIGLKTETTSVGTYDTDSSTVSHQRLEVICGSPTDTKETLWQLYRAMVKKGERSKEKLININEELEFSDMSEEEYERKTTELLDDVKILDYDRVLIVDGIVLK